MTHTKRNIETLKLLIGVVLVQCLIGNSLFAQQGQPFISSFSPLSYSSDNYTSSPQNWGMEKDISGRIIMANTSGLMVYNGVDWRMIPKTEGKLFFNLAKDKTGRIFTGGIDEIGFLKADKKGEIKYHSLRDKLDEKDQDFGHITTIVSYNGEVYFKSSSHIFKYKNGKFKTWYPKISFTNLLSSSAGLFVSEKAQWFRFQNDKLSTILEKKNEELPILKAILPCSKDTLIVATMGEGLLYLSGGEVFPIHSGLDDFTISNACELPGNNIAFATSNNGIIITDKKGKITEIINESMGLSGNSTIFSSFLSRNLWVTMQSGIDLIEYPITTTILNKKNGLNGFPLSMNKFKNKLFVGTNENAFWVGKDSLTNAGILTPLKTKIAEVYGVVQVENKFVIANSKGLQIHIDDQNQYEFQSPKGYGCSSLIKSSWFKNAVYTSFNNEIHPIEIGDNSAKVLGEPIVTPHFVYSLVETDNGNLWAAYNGVSYIDLSNGFENPKIMTLDSLNGLTEKMGFIEVTEINGEVVFGTEIGIYSYNYKSKKLEPKPIFGKKFCDGSHVAYNLTEMRNGDIWVTTNKQTGILRKQNDHTFVYDSLPIIRAPISDVWGIFEDDDNIVWICGTEAIVRYDPSIEFNYRQPYNAFIRGVIINDTNRVFAGNYSNKKGFPTTKQPKNYIPTLEYSENNITFQYGAADYSTDHKLEYSIMLEGRDLAWSNWRKAVEINYTNLPEGEYTFKVRSRNIYGTISEETEYKFIILPPWYRTNWAYFVFAIGGMLFMLFILKLNSMRLLRDKKNLEMIVTSRTEEVRKQKDEILKQSNKLQEAYQRLLELDSFKESMTSMIVHDLKNPLNSILNTSLDEADENQLIRIKQSGHQMLTMVLNILDVYKYEDSEMLVDKNPVEMSELVKGILSEVSYLAKQQDVEIEVDLTQSVAIKGDKEVLGRVIVNLLTNAIKFSPTSSVIKLNGSIVNEHYRIAVTDKGTGIEKKHLKSIFDQFKQIKTTDSGGVRSTGLGLAFCKMAIEAHGGTIEVESEFGKGSTFWFDIPIPKGSEIKELSTPIGNIVAPAIELSEEAKLFLTPYVLELKQIPYYKISTLRKTIQGINPPENIEQVVNKWIGQFNEAAALANRGLINKLINEILDENIEEL